MRIIKELVKKVVILTETATRHKKANKTTDRIIEELIKRKRSVWDLGEDDKWVNDATREDIRRYAEKGDVFGLKLWEHRYLEGDELVDVPNFGVDMLFRKEDRDKVEKLIEEYEAKEWSMETTKQLVDKLAELSVYMCVWV